VEGQGVPIDLLAAVKLYEKAVAAGDIDAQYDMGAACLRGCDETAQLAGVPHSPTNRSPHGRIRA
jgi:TPR repeat protein